MGGGGFHAHKMSGGGGGSIGSPVRSAEGGGRSSVPGSGLRSSSISGSTPSGGGYHVAPSIRTPFEEGKNFIDLFSFTVSIKQSFTNHIHTFTSFQ